MRIRSRVEWQSTVAALIAFNSATAASVANGCQITSGGHRSGSHSSSITTRYLPRSAIKAHVL